VINSFALEYPNTPDAVLMQRYNISRATVARLKKSLGLNKTPEYKSKIQAERMKGRVRTELTCRKIAQKAKGRIVSEETKLKVQQTKAINGSVPKGEKHYRWKGGLTWQRFKNPEYIAWRNAVLARDAYICRDCGRQCKKYEKGLAAHHLKSYTKYPEYRFDIDNGVTLCRNCHMERHRRAPTPKEKILCACGCGVLLDPVDVYGRPRKYVLFHHSKGRPKPDSMKQKLSRDRKGVPLSSEHRQKIADGLRKSTKRVGRPRKPNEG
jgi:hypothetical protein